MKGLVCYGSPRNRIYYHVEQDRDLAVLTAQIWQEYFADVPQPNMIVVNYDYPWKNRLGRIRMTKDEHRSEIALNGILRLAHISNNLRIGVISHEIVHYAHGFGSPLSSHFQQAHAHGVVSSELTNRGLGHYEHDVYHWVECEWEQVYQDYICARQRTLSYQKRKHKVMPLA